MSLWLTECIIWYVISKMITFISVYVVSEDLGKVYFCLRCDLPPWSLTASVWTTSCTPNRDGGRIHQLPCDEILRYYPSGNLVSSVSIRLSYTTPLNTLNLPPVPALRPYILMPCPRYMLIISNDDYIPRYIALPAYPPPLYMDYVQIIYYFHFTY